MILILTTLISSCEPPVQNDKEDLINAIEGNDLGGFYYSVEEDENQVVASFTNSDIENVIIMDYNTNLVDLKYTLIKEKKSNTKNYYKSEIVKTNGRLSLIITDIYADSIVMSKDFPDLGLGQNDSIISSPNHKTLQECIEEFNCTRSPALQCEANRTCKDQFASITCCLSDGQCFSVHFVISPTTFKCRIKNLRPTAPNYDLFVAVPVSEN